MKLAAALLVWFALAGLAQARVELPAAVQSVAPDWHAVGAGEARWLGFSIYEAALWARGARYDPEQTYALVIRYARDFSSAKLTDTSIAEMRRMGHGDAPRLAQWRAALGAIFPDVVAGQSIAALRLPGAGVRFYHDGRDIGAIDDEAFARGFFGIWLDERTRAPELRAHLLGAQ